MPRLCENCPESMRQTIIDERDGLERSRYVIEAELGRCSLRDTLSGHRSNVKRELATIEMELDVNERYALAAFVKGIDGCTGPYERRSALDNDDSEYYEKICGAWPQNNVSGTRVDKTIDAL